MDYLKHVLRPGRLELAFHITDAIRELKPRRSVTELKSFSGLYWVYWRYVSRVIRIALPIKAKLEKVDSKQFDSFLTEEMDAYATLLQSPTAEPVPTLPCREGYLRLDTNVGDKQTAFVRS